MEVFTKLAWLGLAAIHFMPSLAAFRPSLIARLYGAAGEGATGLLLTHRAALFVAVFAVSILAAFDPGARRAGALVAGISMIGFLLLYAKAGMPDGALRGIALADLAGLPLLAWVAFDAIRR